MRIGYARVSSLEQSLERQKIELKKNQVEKIFEEKKSGKNVKDRTVLKDILEKVLRQGDVLVVTSLDRLIRKYEEFEKIIQKIEKKGARLEILDFKLLNLDMSKNENKLIRDIIIKVISYIADNERQKLLIRQREGYNALQKDEKGRYIGKNGRPVGRRPVPLTDLQKKYVEMVDNKELTISQLARDLGKDRKFVYNLKYRYKKEQERMQGSNLTQ